MLEVLGLSTPDRITGPLIFLSDITHGHDHERLCLD